MTRKDNVHMKTLAVKYVPKADKSNNTNHIIYLDYLRSFAIIAVVLLHSISDYIISPSLYGTRSWYINIILNAIVRTGVPVFFMISGYLILSSNLTGNFSLFYKKRLLRILVPLMVWNLLYYVYDCLIGNLSPNFLSFCGFIANIGTKYHLWYLYTILGLYLFAPFLKIIVDNCNNKQIFLLLGIMMLSTSVIPFVNFIFSVNIYLFDPLFNGYIGCFLLGYILGKINFSSKSIWIINILAGISFVLSVLYNHICSSKDGINLVMNSGYNICHFIIASAIFIDAKYLVSGNSPLNKPVSFVSKMSFGIYLVHPLILDLTKKHIMISLSPVFSSLYMFIVVFFVSMILSVIYYRVNKYLGRIYNK